MTSENTTIGLALTALLLYAPIRKLLLLDATSPPWHWDVMFYACLTGCLAAVVVGEADAAIVTGLPVFVMNGVVGVMAFAIERTKSVKIYLSGRHYHFEGVTGAL